MANTVQLKRSATANAVPTTTQLALGELAINTYDGRLYLKKNVSGTESIVEIGSITSGDFTAEGALVSTTSIGDEGGEIRLAKAVTNTTLNTSVTIDVYQNKLRIFETGGTNRGAYIDLSAATASVGSNLLSGSMVYPGAGIPNSTGSAWGTSYGTSGANSVMLRDANQNVDLNNIDFGYSTTATAAGTTTLTAASAYYIYLTGTTTQTVVMPVTSTLSLGWSYHIANNSTGNITINSSGGNLIGTILPGTTIHITCIDTTVTTAAGWDFGFTDFGTATGTGSVVLSASPTFTGTIQAAGITTSASLATSGTSTVSLIGSGAITIGGTASSSAITIGQSNAAQTVNIATGPAASTKVTTVNIGTGGLSGSTTTITIGSSPTNTSTIAMNGSTTFSTDVTVSGNLINPTLKAYSEFKVSNAYTTGTVTLDLSTSNVFQNILTGNTTFVFSNPPANTKVFSFTIITVQDATGGRTITWPTSKKFSGGVTPPPTTTANAIDVWSVMTYDGGTSYIVSLSVKDAK